MARRFVSWSDIETSPVLSSAASMISFDSTFSDTHTRYLQMSPTASEAPSVLSNECRTKDIGLPRLSEEGKIPRRWLATLDDSFMRHDEYFFRDGNVTFLIDGTLYCVHRYYFSRDSIYFSTRFVQLGIRDHEALPTIISISDVERNDFEALLSVLYPTNFETHELTYEQWRSVLHLSTRWGFASLRKLALKSINPPTPHDQLVLARTYSVDQWVLPALTALCSRTWPLSLNEARQMSIEDVILVATAREDIRGGALRVNVADIPRLMAKSEAEAQQGKLEAEMKAKAGAEGNAKTQESMVPKAKLEAEGKQKAEAKAREKREAIKTEREALAKAEAELQDKAVVEARERENWEANTKAEAETDAKVADESNVKEEARATAAKAELEAKQKAEKERLEIEANFKTEAANAGEERERLEKVELCAKQAEEKIARQRAADRAARVAAASSASNLMDPASSWGSRGSWLSKITSAAAPALDIPAGGPALPPNSTSPWSKFHVRNASAPGTELGLLGGSHGPGAPIQCSSIISFSPHESASIHSATSITVVPSESLPAASDVSSPILLWRERKLTNDKQDDKTGDRKDNHSTAALPSEAVDLPDETKNETAVVTVNNHVLSKTTDASKTCDMPVVEVATALGAPGCKYADSAPTYCQDESTRSQQTAPAELVASSCPSEDLEHASAPPIVTPPQPSPAPVLGGFPLETPHHWQPPLFLRGIPTENDATMAKECTPTPESVASTFSKPNVKPETLNDLDLKNVAETPAQTKPYPAAQDSGVKPDGATTGLTLGLSQHSNAGSWGSAITNSGEIDPEGLVKPALRLDCIREVCTASTISASRPGTPTDETPSLRVDKEYGYLSKMQKKKMREKARRQAQKGERSVPRLPSGA
ncbi:hypothetical protein EI94DRAFT_1659180 [Lactarius quietus]|nr:hypothetical protein EI94DRAFT_1659180 [Lactarius quietus]